MLFPQIRREVSKKPLMLTTMIVPKEHEDGSFTTETVVIEKDDDPLLGLTFEDFSLSKLLRRGISYKSLQISHDLRLGHEEEIDAFNSKLESLSSAMFNVNMD